LYYHPKLRSEMTDSKDIICKDCASVSDIEVNNGAQSLCQHDSICMTNGATNGNFLNYYSCLD
jgi:hypothetical protein